MIHQENTIILDPAADDTTDKLQAGPDSPSPSNWLEPQWEKKLADIRKQVRILIAHAGQSPTVLKYYTPHGASHCEAVERNLHLLLPGDCYKRLSQQERFYLLGAAWLHDVGMFYEALEDVKMDADTLRRKHHLLSEKIIVERYTMLRVDEDDAHAFGLLARYHRKQEPIDDCPEIVAHDGDPIRLRLLAAYVRLADALHIDQQRAMDKEYAVVLTYGISTEQKIHWIRSKLVGGFYIDTERCLICVNLNFPSNVHEFLQNKNSELISKKEEFLTRLHDLCEVVIKRDLRRELADIKNIFIKYKISTFIDFEYQIHEVHFKKALLQQLWDTVHADIMFHGPSSSLIYTLVLDTILNIITSTQELSRTSELKHFLDEMLKKTKKSRKCHFGLLSILNEYKDMTGSQQWETCCRYITDIKKIVECYISKNENSKTCDTSDNSKANDKSTLSNLFNLAKAQIENKNEFNFFSFLEIYTKLRLCMQEEDKIRIRLNASKFMEDLPQGSPTREVCKAIINAAVKKICELGRIPLTQASEEKDSPSRKVPARLGFLLYGYSSYSIRTLCGFRDYIAQEVLTRCAASYSALFAQKLFRGNGISTKFEEILSAYFDIYVCECQPKNIQDWEGTSYHDGTEYVRKLRRRGFRNISQVADAMASNILAQYYDMQDQKTQSSSGQIDEPSPKDETKSARYPRINYMLLGVNGFSEKYIYHSAGHLTSIYCALQKGRTDVILSVQTSKFMQESDIPDNNGKMSRSIPYETHTVRSGSGWNFLESYKGERIRDMSFIPYDRRYFKLDSRQEDPMTIYTPLEDRIRFSEVDYIITEFGFYSTYTLAYEKLFNWSREKEDNGNTPSLPDPPIGGTPPVYRVGPKMLLNRREYVPGRSKGASQADQILGLAPPEKIKCIELFTNEYDQLGKTLIAKTRGGSTDATPHPEQTAGASQASATSRQQADSDSRQEDSEDARSNAEQDDRASDIS